MKHYVVTESKNYLGIYLYRGDIITIISKVSWFSNRQPEKVWYGNIIKHYPKDFIFLQEELDCYKSKLEIKITQMWNRQPYMQKQLGAVK